MFFPFLTEELLNDLSHKIAHFFSLKYVVLNKKNYKQSFKKKRESAYKKKEKTSIIQISRKLTQWPMD